MRKLINRLQKQQTGEKCKVIVTARYPNSYKVVLPHPDRDNNSASRFFKSKKLAEKEARKIDNTLNKKHSHPEGI